VYLPWSLVPDLQFSWKLWVLHPWPGVVNGKGMFVYYESIKRELRIRSIYECRCDERLQTKTKEFTRLIYTGLVVELEHQKHICKWFFFPKNHRGLVKKNELESKRRTEVNTCASSAHQPTRSKPLTYHVVDPDDLRQIGCWMLGQKSEHISRHSERSGSIPEVGGQQDAWGKVACADRQGTVRHGNPHSGDYMDENEADTWTKMKQATSVWDMDENEADY